MCHSEERRAQRQPDLEANASGDSGPGLGCGKRGTSPVPTLCSSDLESPCLLRFCIQGTLFTLLLAEALPVLLCGFG